MLLLMIYVASKQVKTVPEKNLIALCFALLICDLIGWILTMAKNYIIGNPCKTVAALLHFFSLALYI